ncbi:MAG: hypothetical protein QOG47_3174, partial [Mycobacterium sp.]|nr:hypothetical protein [Mycobacterium sp.]
MATAGVRLDYTGDRLAQRQLMHAGSP